MALSWAFLLAQPRRELQGEEQQEADGGGHCELAEEAAALLEHRIDGIELAGDQQQRQRQQGRGAPLIRTVLRRHCQAGSRG
jgi:hypothetical protein